MKLLCCKITSKNDLLFKLHAEDIKDNKCDNQLIISLSMWPIHHNIVDICKARKARKSIHPSPHEFSTIRQTRLDQTDANCNNRN